MHQAWRKKWRKNITLTTAGAPCIARGPVQPTGPRCVSGHRGLAVGVCLFHSGEAEPASMSIKGRRKTENR